MIQHQEFLNKNALKKISMNRDNEYMNRVIYPDIKNRVDTKNIQRVGTIKRKKNMDKLIR